MNMIGGKTVGAWVAADYRLAAVFKKHGIDFCCKGNRSVEEACRQKNISPEKVSGELQAVLDMPPGDTPVSDFRSWPLDLLADYIEKKHHRFVAAQIPDIEAYLEKLCRVHGSSHAELFSIRDLFHEAAGALTMHMKKEELMLFPFVRSMVHAQESESVPPPPFGTVQNPIRMMMQEHDTEGGRFAEIRALSNGYQAPEDACTTYRLAYTLLRAFEDDLHLHIHLENNILFPGAIRLESRLLH